MEDIDAQILLKAKYGDREALSSIVRLHHRRLRAWLAAICGDTSAADDLAQETFLRAFERLDRVQSASQLSAFLRGIGRNVAREHFRARARDEDRATAYLQWMEDWCEEREAEPWMSDDPKVVDRLRQCLEALPQRSRQIVRMRYFDEMDATKIGEELSMNGPGVRSALRRIRVALFQCLRENSNPAEASS